MSEDAPGFLIGETELAGNVPGCLTEDQAFALMTRMALDDAAAAGVRWADQAFLAAGHYAGPIGGVAVSNPAAVEIVGRLALDMIEVADRIAADARCTPDQRRALILGQVDAYRARLDELLVMALPMGHA